MRKRNEHDCSTSKMLSYCFFFVNQLDSADQLDQEEKELGFMVMEALALLLSHNQKNASTIQYVKKRRRRMFSV
jgi:hypothetical protein